MSDGCLTERTLRDSTSYKVGNHNQTSFYVYKIHSYSYGIFSMSNIYSTYRVDNDVLRWYNEKEGGAELLS